VFLRLTAPDLVNCARDAARFTPSTVVPDTTHAVSTSTLGITGVTAVTFLVLCVAVLTSAVDRRFSAQRLQLARIIHEFEDKRSLLCYKHVD
jgi:hypothetical protein